MSEKIIGLIYRYGKNDYGIMLNDFDKVDSERLMDIYTRYADEGSGIRGDGNKSINDANVEYWENMWLRENLEERRKWLAHKMFIVGMEETNILYDDQADEQVTETQIAEDLKTYKGTAYWMEAFLQFCDGGQDEGDHRMFFETSMEIVHYMENMKEV